jgi:hypothetical protein
MVTGPSAGPVTTARIGVATPPQAAFRASTVNSTIAGRAGATRRRLPVWPGTPAAGCPAAARTSAAGALFGRNTVVSAFTACHTTQNTSPVCRCALRLSHRTAVVPSGSRVRLTTTLGTPTW